MDEIFQGQRSCIAFLDLSQNGMANGIGAAPSGTYQREPRKAPAAPSAGAKDVDFGAMSIKGGRGYRFSFKSGTWGDTAVKVQVPTVYLTDMYVYCTASFTHMLQGLQHEAITCCPSCCSMYPWTLRPRLWKRSSRGKVRHMVTAWSLRGH